MGWDYGGEKEEAEIGGEEKEEVEGKRGGRG